MKCAHFKRPLPSWVILWVISCYFWADILFINFSQIFRIPFSPTSVSRFQIHQSFFKISKYPTELLHYKVIRRQGLRSTTTEDNLLLSVPRTKFKTFADRLFGVGAPALWNSLPYSIRSVQSVLTFKTMLKTHLFREAFSP